MNRLLRKTLPAMLAALFLAGCVATAPTIEKKEAAAVGAEIPREERVLTPSFFPDRNLLVRFYSDLTVPEIAAVTHQPEGTIKSRLHRALSHLNTILQAEGLEAEV